MKIGILTQPLHSNYGGLLQNYALQQVLIKYGHSVKTIDWQYDFISKDAKRKEWLKTVLLSKFNYFYRTSHFLTEKEKKILIAKPQSFITTHINTTSQVYSRVEIERKSRDEKFDAYIVGSDQCWRPKYNGQFLETMFLDFIGEGEKVKKIAYAVSFGAESWEYSEKQTSTCAELAKQFDLVTVREMSGINLCEKYLHVKAQHVLDPTLLLEKDDYVALMEGTSFNEGTLTTYILDKNIQTESFITNVEKITGLERIEINPKPFDYKKAKNNLTQYEKISVPDWLSAIYHSKITIVDSFHGAVFSILFNKPFWVLGNQKRGMARFESLLKTFGLDNRMIDIAQSNQVDLFQPIDWSRVNNVLSIKREESLNLLINSLK